MRGATIVRASGWDRAVVNGSLADVVGRTVRGVGRRGKWLKVELDEGSIFAHLGMTGDFSRHREATARLPWERARVDLARGGAVTSVRYRDPRRFGRIVVADQDIAQWRALGPDPLHDGIDVPRLLDVAQARRAAIKVTLMDQKVLAGVGNILANEVLFAARVDPRRPSRSLTLVEMRAVARQVRNVIARFLARHDRRIAVYGRSGQACLRCGKRLRGAVVGGRATTYCPACQK
jgi:formamidopyrimidine-DNA glycosylase